MSAVCQLCIGGQEKAVGSRACSLEALLAALELETETPSPLMPDVASSDLNLSGRPTSAVQFCSN